MIMEEENFHTLRFNFFKLINLSLFDQKNVSGNCNYVNLQMKFHVQFPRRSRIFSTEILHFIRIAIQLYSKNY